MVGSVAFLMKDVVLLAVSVYLFKQDLIRVAPVTNAIHVMAGFAGVRN
jgi:hypothetical protein